MSRSAERYYPNVVLPRMIEKETAAPRIGAGASRTITAGTIGNILEWFDFSIYGYFAISIGKTFFPATDPVSQVLATFGVFAVGYVMRPLGALLTGHIGDRCGRRTALTFSVMAMAIPTFLIGLLPGYAVLGVMAPVLLTILRMIQGLSVGGEYTTAMVFLVERSEARRRGLMGSIVSSSGCAGLLLGSATGFLVDSLLPADAVTAWGWRIPFVLGLLVGVVGYLLRRDMQEVEPQKHEHAPMTEIVRDHLGVLGRFAGLSVFNAVPFYIAFLYVVSWLQDVDGIHPAHALAINTASIALLIPVELFAGWLSDRIGRKVVARIALLAALAFAYPLFWLMHGPGLLYILAGQFGLVVILGLYDGTQPAMLVEAAPVRVRCSIVALGYNITLGILGGLTPLVAEWLIDRTDDNFVPAYMIMASAVVSLLALASQRETYRDKLRSA